MNTLFWQDDWWGHASLRNAFFDATRGKFLQIREVWSQDHGTWDVVLRRHPSNLVFQQWSTLMEQLSHFWPTPRNDESRWRLTNDGAYVAFSLYMALGSPIA
jgi:hypothetical protein